MDNRRPTRPSSKSRGAALERPTRETSTRSSSKVRDGGVDDRRDRSRNRTPRTRRQETSTKGGGVSVMDAVSKMEYAPKHSIPTIPVSASQTKVTKFTSQAHSEESLMSALGAPGGQPGGGPSKPSTTSTTRTSRLERPSRVDRVRNRSTSRTRSRSKSQTTSEEKKQIIREARARSRSRSTTRASTMRPSTTSAVSGAGAADMLSVAPSMISRTSEITEKTKPTASSSASRRDGRSISGLAGTKKTTQQLILLRHAARCPYGPDSTDPGTRGPCPIHKQCADMKILLSHMTTCQNTTGDCPFPQCSKSKGFLEVIYPNYQPQQQQQLPMQQGGGGGGVNDQRSMAPAITSNSLQQKKDSSLLVWPPPVPPPEAFIDEAPPDIEMASGANDEALEQQSLLAEIHARKMKRAPKIKHKAPTPSSSSSGGTATSSNSSTAGSSSFVSVTSLIKRRAEELLHRMMRQGGQEDDGIFFGTKQSLMWTRIGKNFCICCGFIVILSIIALILLYVFGSEQDWLGHSSQMSDSGAPLSEPVVLIPKDTTDNNRPPGQSSPSSSTPSDAMDTQHDGPTPSPTSFAMALPDYTVRVIEEHNAHSGEERPPQAKAYVWIREEQQYLSDKFKPEYGETVKFEADQWLNRFALATLYYSTTLGKSKLQRSSGIQIHKPSNWTHSGNWLAMGVSECEWSFYGCDGRDSLWITNNGLRGTLPPEMGMLTRVRDMAIMNNPKLTGSLPSQLGLLHHTVSVNFQENKLGGSIPSELGTMKKLRWLYLNGNKLTDNIPTAIGRSSSRIAFLWLNDNKLSGSLDPALFSNDGFKYLKELLLHNNELTGPIPDGIGRLPRIRFISMYNNKITGTIPTTLGMLTDLEVLKLHDTDLTGSVPEEVCHLVQRGSLRTLTVNCDVVVCNCGCSCTDDDQSNPPPVDSPSESTTAAEPEAGMVGVIPKATPNPTSTPSLGRKETPAPTDKPTPARPVELDKPSATPSNAPQTRQPTKAPIMPPSPRPTPIATIVEQLPPVSAFEDAYLGDYGGYRDVSAAAEFMLQLPDFTKEALLEAESPQSMALDWLSRDPNLEKYSFERKTQRFAMASIFLSTGGSDWAENGLWLDYSQHECDWSTTYANGDVCNTHADVEERFIRDLVQWANDLVGPLPPEIGLLTTLDKIFLGVNNITSLPTEIGLLSNNLRVLNMMHCSIEGPIPSELGELTKLKKMDLSENFFEGVIPTEIGRLNLENLYLNHNLLYGSVPVHLFSVTSAKGFNIAANSFTGTLPSEIGNLVHVQWINLYGNWFEGHIPTEIGLMRKVTALHTSHNVLVGSIPSELGMLSTSHTLSLDFRYNQLTGLIPTELGGLTNLVVLALEGNSDLKGDMPGEICKLASDWKLETLSLDCSSVKCDQDGCGTEDAGGVCVCAEDYNYYDDDKQQ